MAYDSVDKLQKVLADKVFHYTTDSKKAAGRAIGTLIEIITFYLLKSWGFEHSLSIEKSLPEYGNAEITHNVEFSCHPLLGRSSIALPGLSPLTAGMIFSNITDPINLIPECCTSLLSSWEQKRRIQTWFNIITPPKGTINGLKSEITQLRDKGWKRVHS